MSHLRSAACAHLPPRMLFSFCPSFLVTITLFKDQFKRHFLPQASSHLQLFLLSDPVVCARTQAQAQLTWLLGSLCACDACISSHEGWGPDSFIFDFPHHLLLFMKSFYIVRVQWVKLPLPPSARSEHLLCAGSVLRAVARRWHYKYSFYTDKGHKALRGCGLGKGLL